MIDPFSDENITLDYSADEFDVVALRFHFNTGTSLATSAVTVFVILKFSTVGMGAFKFHLLNIQTSALVMDLLISAYFVPYPIHSVGGFCGAGELSRRIGFMWGEIIPYYSIHYGLAYVGVSLALGVLYRYLALVQKDHLMRSYKVVPLSLLSVFVLASPCLVPMAMAYKPRAEAIEYVRQVAPSLVQFYSDNSCSTVGISSLLLFYIGFAVAAVVIVVVFIASVSIKTRRILLAARSQMSQKTFKLQKQMLWVLWLQCLIPLLVLAVPVLCMLILFLLGVHNMKNISITAMQLLATHASCNGVITIVTISPYRRAVTQVFSVCFRAKTENRIFVQQSANSFQSVSEITEQH